MVKGIREALSGEPDIEIVGEATSGAQVLPLVARTSPDLLLLDLRMPELGGLEVLELMRQAHPDVKVAILSVHNDPAQIAGAFERGVCAYILKSIDWADLGAAIRQAVSGTFISLGPPAVEVAAAEANDNGAGLSSREVEILQGVARGLSNRAIASELWLSDQTVKFHLHNVYRKLGVSNRTEAARYAFEHGLAETSPDASPAVT
jgi:two-component system, NarL family, nitrate/nitrite response regulator NarL